MDQGSSGAGVHGVRGGHIGVREIQILQACSCKGAEVGNVLLLNRNRKSCIRNPTPPRYLTLSDIERSK